MTGQCITVNGCRKYRTKKIFAKAKYVGFTKSLCQIPSLNQLSEIEISKYKN